MTDFPTRYGFHPDEFRRLQDAYRSGKLSLKTNVITFGNDWEVRYPRPEDSAPVPPAGSEEEKIGREAIRRGSYGLVLMNGGAATRFQKPGENLPKGAFEIMEMDGRPRSFMELKLAHARWAEKEYGGAIPVWILNSYFTDAKTREILEKNRSFAKKSVSTYCQGIMKRVVPSAGDLEIHYGKSLGKLEKKIAALPPGKDRAAAEDGKRKLESDLASWMAISRKKTGEEIEAEGEDRYNPPGHLDATLFLVLDPSRPLLRMIDLGVEYLHISNIDNLGATVCPALVGLLSRRSSGEVRILCEVSKKPAGQKGGALARVYDPSARKEWTQIIEEFAFPPAFDQDRIPEFNNATYVVAVSSLLSLFGLDRETLRSADQEVLRGKVKAVTDRLPVYIAIKEIRGREGVRPVVQFERLQGDLTRLLQPLAIRTADRFFPVKSREDIPIVVPDLRRILSGRVLLA
jgi:UDP-N-acetylglucosamine pyrophosphorylase